MTAAQQRHCGCCGSTLGQSGADWCYRCRSHVSIDHRLAPWDRTYFAQHGRECPYQVRMTGGTP